MTARWSGVLVDDGGNAVGEEDLEVERRRACSRRVGRWSPEVMFQTGARERETSVVEADSRHLGNLSEGRREAERGGLSSDGEGNRPGRGPWSFSSQKGAVGFKRARSGRRSVVGSS